MDVTAALAEFAKLIDFTLCLPAGVILWACWHGQLIRTEGQHVLGAFALGLVASLAIQDTELGYVFTVNTMIRRALNYTAGTVVVSYLVRPAMDAWMQARRRGEAGERDEGGGD